MTKPPELPAEVLAVREFFKREHNPEELPFAGLGDNREGMILYIPGPMPSLNLQTLLATINECLEHPDVYADFLNRRHR